MKKAIALILAALLTLSLVACNSDGGSTSKPSSSGSSSASSASLSASDNSQWKQFLKEYENWVDDYIKLVKKYAENPSDMSILSEYTKMAADAAEWAEKADKIESELNDPKIAAEFSAQLAKIAVKLAQAAV